MRFMMFVATDLHPDANSEQLDEVEGWFEEVNSNGRWIAGDRLAPARDAKTVRVRFGEVAIADGPFTQARETIVGFDILECASMEQAIEIAAKHPMARAGRIELRQFWPLEEK